MRIFFSVVILMIFMLGCQPVQETKLSEATLSSLEQDIVWNVTLNGKGDYEFSHRRHPEIIHVTQIMALTAYLEHHQERGKGIIILTKIYQTLPQDEIRSELHQLIQLLEQNHYIVLGIQIVSSTRSHEKIYQINELPF